MNGNGQKGKKYPFSGTKHAHDIDFRRVRVKNEIAAIERGEVSVSDKTYDKLISLENLLDDLLGYMCEGIVWLTGEQYGLAKECVAWAMSMRGNKK